MASSSVEKYPEHIKLQGISEISQQIGQFLDWINTSKNFRVCTRNWQGDWDPVYPDIQGVLAEFFGIDLGLLENEKRLMLDEIRTQNLARDLAEGK